VEKARDGPIGLVAREAGMARGMEKKAIHQTSENRGTSIRGPTSIKGFCRCFTQPQHALTVILITCTSVNIADPLQPPTVPKTNGPIYSRFLIPTYLFYTLDQGSQKWLPLPSAHLGRIKRRRFPSFSAILFNHNVLH
jgi:hypothetical protein